MTRKFIGAKKRKYGLGPVPSYTEVTYYFLWFAVWTRKTNETLTVKLKEV